MNGLTGDLRQAPTFLATATGLAMIGMLASYLPAGRASSVDPIESLRAD